MKLKQIAVSIENSPGRLYEITYALGQAGVNLIALNLVDTGLFGQLRMLVSDVSTARKVLMGMYVPIQINEVLAVEIEDTPGSLAETLKILLDAGITLIYTYSYVSASGKGTMIFRFSDNDKAIKVLQSSGSRLLDPQELGMLETE